MNTTAHGRLSTHLLATSASFRQAVTPSPSAAGKRASQRSNHTEVTPPACA